MDTIETLDTKIYEQLDVLIKCLNGGKDEIGISDDKLEMIEELASGLDELKMKYSMISIEFFMDGNSSTSCNYYSTLTSEGILDELNNYKRKVEEMNLIDRRNYEVINRNKLNVKEVKKNLELCPDCKINMEVHHDLSIIKCGNCGLEERILIHSCYDRHHYKTQDKSYNPTSSVNDQETLKHYKKWIQTLLAVDCEKITDDVLEIIKRKCVKERYRICNLNIEQMRSILKELKMTQYNNYSPYIIRKLNNRRPISIPYKYMKQLKDIFVQIIRIYSKLYKMSNLKYYPAFIARIIKSYYVDTPLVELLPNIHKQSSQTESKTTKIWEKLCEQPELKFLISNKLEK